MADDSKEVEDGMEGFEVEAPPTHEPFSLPILPMVSTAQAQNGLRHQDHHRYRQYCYRRLRRIRKGLKFHHGRGRYKPAPLPEYYDKPAYLEIPLVNAERAWAYGMQIKADNATKAVTHARSTGHAKRRFAKAFKAAEELVAQVAIHCDTRSQKEASAYLSWMKGVFHSEREEWAEAHACLQECATAWEQLALTATSDQLVLYRAKVKDLAPLLRLCTYHGGIGGDQAVTTMPTEGADMKVNFRGKDVPVAQAELQQAVIKCQRGVAAMDISTSTGEHYGEISVVFDEAQKKVHAQMLEGEGNNNAALVSLEHYLREVGICLNIERNLILLRTLSENVSTSEAKKNQRPDEGVRLCDMAMDEFNGLAELPDVDNLEPGLEGLKSTLLNQRLMYVGLTHAAAGNVAQSVALFELLATRIGAVADAPSESLKRVHDLLEESNELLTGRIAKWRARILAQYTLSNLEEAPVESAGQEAHFPPKVSPIACKPFVIDIAHGTMEAPSMQELIKQKSGVMGGLGRGLGKLKSVGSGWFK